MMAYNPKMLFQVSFLGHIHNFEVLIKEWLKEYPFLNVWRKVF